MLKMNRLFSRKFVLGSIGRCKSRMGDVQKGRGWRAVVVSAPLSSPFRFWRMTCLKDGPFKKWWVWWGGGGRRGKFSVYTISFFFHRDKHEYFFIRVRKSSFLLLLLFCENIHIGCVRLGNLGLDFKIRISDLQSNAKSENGFQRWNICFWIFLFTVRLGNPKKDLKNCP